ncbi:alpha/beta fold hydrolase [Flagellimonas aequoris]|uniref:Alpha/beta hydrolase n=1 Tax=Flagellimonas aequoris TaxID=2306997 RepID=A0A418N8W6_9FLAO|nr:alpha/beta hydrolase [Allomuricauda aequoris]RIV71549.1 alpha/beta hydrolase [Allomuricauda aequoris]TXK03114.1 alpha/beta hydrolase [Allomuricauda aequoris]
MDLKRYMTLLLLTMLMGSCEKFELDTEADTFFHVKIVGTELPVLVRGNTSSKKFIIYINGGPGATSLDVARADLFHWSDGLEENFAMVYYDQRGCGNAQGNFDESTLTVAQYVRDLDAIVTVLQDKYDNPSIYLMGASFGGYIGAKYLMDDNLESKIDGWISVDGAYNFDYDLSWQYRRTFMVNIALEELGKGNRLEHWTSALEWADANPVITTREQKNQLREFIGWPGQIIIPEEESSISIKQYLGIGFASSYNPFPAFLSTNLEIVNHKLNADAEGDNLISEVSNITLPSLLIWGRYDDLIVPEEGRAVFDNFGTPVGDKFFELLPNSSHEPYISDPTNFKNLIIDFVQSY